MSTLLYLMPVALFLGGVSLIAFLWALRSGQYDDLDGAAARVLIDEPAEAIDPSLGEAQRSSAQS